MAEQKEIRADFNSSSIVVYQAYKKEIAEPALKGQKFIAPFSMNRMTWIKPSFLWLMERSNWGHKSGQENILAVRITRSGWEEALSSAVLTSPESNVYRDHSDWRQQFKNALVHVQWDPERSMRGASLNYGSIQVGLSRHVIQKFVDEWIIEINDYTGIAKKMYDLIKQGNAEKAKRFLPNEKAYPVNSIIARRLGMKT